MNCYQYGESPTSEECNCVAVNSGDQSYQQTISENDHICVYPHGGDGVETATIAPFQCGN